MTNVQDKIDSSQVKIDETLQRFADGFSYLRRSPILHTPAEDGLEFEDVSFPALDGVPLEAWYIAATGSNKLIIANHPMGFSRSGIPTHLQPWHADWAPSGNGFEVNLVPDYKILHDAGYNVLAYDLRNHGMSSAANGGVCTSGITEARDVVGSIEYVRSRPDTRDMIIGLFSRCMGGSSTFRAMQRYPEAFAGIRCLVSPQPVTTRLIVERRLGVMASPPTSSGSAPMCACARALGSKSVSRGSGQRASASLPCCTRCGPTRSPTRVTCRACSTTSPWPISDCSGSRARPPAGTATWSSSVVLYR